MNKLVEIQNELKAPKGQYNSFGRYNYRSCEDILEALKPILKKHNATLTITDEIFTTANRFYVKSTAKFSCGDEKAEVSAFAREEETKKGMDASQITGSASSYARKYALNGLFLIDDTKDADTRDNRDELKPAIKKVESTKENIEISATRYSIEKRKSSNGSEYIVLYADGEKYISFNAGIEELINSSIATSRPITIVYKNISGKRGEYKEIVEIK